MTPRRIGRHIGGGAELEDEGAGPRESLREAFASWPSGVAIVAMRAQGRTHGLTVSAFIPVSLDPPTVLVSLGPNASVASYLEAGSEFAISVLAADQRGLASRFADTLPVGASPFAGEGPPVVEGAVTALVCTADEVLTRGDHRLVLGRVTEIRAGRDAPALVYHRRRYGATG